MGRWELLQTIIYVSLSESESYLANDLRKDRVEQRHLARDLRLGERRKVGVREGVAGDLMPGSVDSPNDLPPIVDAIAAKGAEKESGGR